MKKKDIEKLFLLLLISLMLIMFGLFLFKFKTVKIDEFFISTLGAVIGGILAFIISYLYIKTIRPLKVFISYSHHDRPIVEKLLSDISSARVKVLTDNDVLLIGDNIKEKIYRTINDSDIFMMILSSSSSKSEFVNQELEIATKSKVSIFPIIIKEGEYELPNAIKELKYIELSDDNYNECIDNIRKSLMHLKKP